MIERANPPASTVDGPAQTQWTRELYRAVGDRERRAVLSLVREHDHPIDPDDLAHLLAARTATDGADPPTERERWAAAVALHNGHLPKLEAAGLVRSDPIDGRVEPTDLSVPRAGEITDAVESVADREASLDLLFGVLADPLRRSLVVVLEDQPDEVFPLDLPDLAEAIEGYEKLTDATVVTDWSRREITTSLHHAHLPKLDDVGVLDYDTDDRTVDYEGHPAFAAL